MIISKMGLCFPRPGIESIMNGMKPITILAIAPYEGMAEALQTIAKTREDIRLTIRVGDLQEGLEAASAVLREQSFDIVLSRGGTAELLREKLDLNVEEVEFSIVDVLRCIKLAEGYGGKFAVAGFKGLTDKAGTLAELLQVPLKITRFKGNEEIRQGLTQLKEESYSLVICDMSGIAASRDVGMNTIFVPSGLESVEEAIDRAVGTVKKTMEADLKADLYRQALRRSSERIVLQDDSGKTVFSTLEPGLEEELFSGGLSDPGKKEEIALVRNIGDTEYRIRRSILDAKGCSFFCYEIRLCQSLFGEEDRTVSVFNSYDDAFPDPLMENSSANQVGRIHELLDQYASTSLPVVITGEKGTGKDRAAVLIYHYSPLQNKPYYVIDCTSLSPRKVKKLLESENSPLNEAGVTIHIRRPEALTREIREKLFSYVTESDMLKRNRLIVSVQTRPGEEEELSEWLSLRHGFLSMFLPPLRERLEDLPGIAALYINQMNLILGKHIVGFTAEAMELLKGCSWKGNLDQFRKVLRESMVISEGSYISEEELKRVLILDGDERLSVRGSMRQETDASERGSGAELDLSLPLDRINKQIARLVLKEEGGNREKTAKRLGISRATLWRMLKDQI